MRLSFRSTLPMLAMVALLGGLSFNSARAEDPAPAPAAKGSVSGTVTKDGQPAANVKVAVIKRMMGGGAPAPQVADGDKPAEKGKDKPKGDRPRPEPVATGTTDDKGAFTINDVPAGDYVVVAGERGQGMGRERVTITAGETAKVTIELKMREPKK